MLELGELLDGIKSVRAAATLAGSDPARSVFCERVAREVKGIVTAGWRVSIVMEGLPSMLYSGEGQTVQEAIAKCIESIRVDQNKCKVCGGRMDGPCKHSH